MNKRIIYVIGLACLLLGGLFAFKFYQINQAISQIKPPPPATVAATAVRQENWDLAITGVGTLTAVAGVAVSNEVAGKVKAIYFESGQSVKEGQLLVELDTSTDEAELKALVAEQDMAKIHFARNAQMIDRHFVSQSDYDQSKATLDQTTAAVAARKSVLEKKRIRAPFSGELAIRQINLGQYLAPGTAIVDLQQLSPIYVDFSLPERYLGQLKLNQTLGVSVQAFPQAFSGRIAAISPEIDMASRTVRIRGVIDNVGRELKPGMFAQVRIESGQSQPVLTLPDTAISYNPYGNSVFLIQNGEQGLVVQNRQVSTGQTRDGRVEILSGLQAGDPVVSAGQLKLRNGMPVTLDSQAAPGERL